MAASHFRFSKSYFLVIFCLINFHIIAQPSFFLDTIYLENTAIEKIRSSYNGEYWFLTKDPSQQLFRITRTGILQNRSDDFLTQLSDGITDFVCPDTNEIIIGTNSSYAIYYKNGEYTSIDINAGLQSNENHVNSLFLKRDVIKIYGDTVLNHMIVGIATNGQAYWNDSITGDYQPIGGYSWYENRKFLSRNDFFFMDKPRPHYVNFTYQQDYVEIDTLEYGHILCANVNFYYSGGAISNSWLGFEKGYAHRTIYDHVYKRYLINQKIRAIVDFNESYVLIAADSGLYINTWPNPKRLDFGIGDYTAYDVEVCNGLVYVATDRGLLKLINMDCSEYNVTFYQDRQYADADSIENFSLDPIANGGIQSSMWDFGDGTGSDQLFPLHSYNEPGNYSIRLIASNGFCSDTAFGLAVVYAGSEIFSPMFNLAFNYKETGYAFTSERINIADLDGDSYSEIFIPQSGLFKVTSKPSLKFDTINLENTDYYSKCLVGDMNNDGLNEIVSASILVNKGDFSFETIQYDDREAFWYYSDPCLMDYNNDGNLDIIFGNKNQLVVYLNRGSFTFEKLIISLSPSVSGEISGIKWIDLDSDNDNDIIISGISKDNVLINHNGTYILPEENALSSLSPVYMFPADLNNDRHLDIYIRSDAGNYLLLGKDDSLVHFENTWLTHEKFPSQLSIEESAIGVTFDDFDNNGYVDCLKNTYDVFSSRLFMNYGDMIFKNDESNPFRSGISNRITTIASADISDDGKLDILMDKTDYFNKDEYVFINESPSSNNWIKFHLYGSRSNINAIGTKIFIKANNGLNSWQTRIIESTHGINSQNGYEVHFGLGNADVVDTVEILWTSGHKNVFTNFSANNTYDIIESLIRYSGDTVICENTNPLMQLPNVHNVNYEWLRNGNKLSTENEIKINEPGSYKCIIYYPGFTDTTRQINIYHKDVTPSNIWFESDSILCPGDSALINSNAIPGASYRWIINGIDTAINRNFYFTYDTMPVQQILVNNLGCSDTSRALSLKYYPVPEFELDDFTDICQGDSSEISTDSTFARYLWSNGATTWKTFLNPADSLILWVWNEFDCKSSDTIAGILRPLPFIELGKDTVIGYKEILFIGACSSNNYTYFWNDSTSDCYRNFHGEELNIGQHQFSLIITSEYNCVSYDTINIEVQLDSENKSLNDENVFIFPNPSDGYFNIYLNDRLIGEQTTIEIFNSSGSLINSRKVEIEAPRVIGFSVKSNGVYFVKITSNGYSEIRKIRTY